MVLSMVLLAASLSVDALGVGASYGLRKIKIPLVSKCIICVLSILYAGISLMVGKSLAWILPESLSKAIGILILAFMGIFITLGAIFKKDTSSPTCEKISPPHKPLLKLGIKSLGITIQVIKNPVQGDVDKSGSIDAKESLLLGLALSVDAIGVGIGSALSGFHSMFIPFTVGLFQMIFLYVGGFIGEKAQRNTRHTRLISLAPGLLLILLAILRI